MSLTLRPVLSLLLALVIAFTGFQTAAARGQPLAAGVMELCIGTTVVTVHVDAEGNPVEQRHLCPDGAFALFSAAAEGFAASAPAAVWRRWSAPEAPPVPVTATAPAAQARGPPVPV